MSMSTSNDTGNTSAAATSAATGSTSIKQQQQYPSWHSSVAGAVAGAGSRMVTAPLDLIRVRRQLMSSNTSLNANVPTTTTPLLFQQIRAIIDTEGGISALYRGNIIAMYLWISYSSVQFTIYNISKDILTQHNIQQQQQQHNQQQHQQQEVSDQKAAGTSTTTNSSTKRTILFSPTSIAFISGATGGVIATASTYPFDLCRTIFMAHGKQQQQQKQPTATATATTSTLHVPLKQSGGIPPRSIYDFVIQLYQLQGIRGFYAGSLPAIVQIIPYMGLNFAIYDQLISTTTTTKKLSTYSTDNNNNSNSISSNSSSTGSTSNVNNTSILLSAYAGSISGGVSKIITYPLDTVKRRLQAQAYFNSSSNNIQEAQHQHTTSTLFQQFTTSATTSVSKYNQPQHSSKMTPTTTSATTPTYNNMIHCFKTIYEKEGIYSFYRGMVPSVLKTAISTSLTFALYRCTMNILENQHDHHYHSNHQRNTKRFKTTTVST